MVLPHRKNMSPHPDTLCSFRAKQCFLVHLNLDFLAKNQHIRMCLVFGFTRLWPEPTTYLTRSDHTSHYTPDADCLFIFYLNLLRYNCKHISYILERRVWRYQLNKSKDIQHNGAINKRTNNDLQNTTQKTKYRLTTPPSPKKTFWNISYISLSSILESLPCFQQ
jgi:hypothetical protein